MSEQSPFNSKLARRINRQQTVTKNIKIPRTSPKRIITKTNSVSLESSPIPLSTYMKNLQPTQSVGRQRFILDSSIIRKMNKELREIQRENSPFCNYINSYQIHEELDKIQKDTQKNNTKIFLSQEKKCETQAKCIKKLVSLHLRRLNIKSNEIDLPMLDINELSRNSEIKNMSIDQIHTESLKMWKLTPRIMPKNKRSATNRNHSESLFFKPKSMFTRKIEATFKPLFRKPILATERHCNSTIKEGRNNGKWYSDLEKGCDEELSKNATMDSLAQSTEKKYFKKYKDYQGTVTQLMGVIKAPRIIIHGNGNFRKVLNLNEYQ